MIQLYSKGCEYAIRVLTHMNQTDCERGFSVQSVCKKARTPESFTRKIFQTLVKHRLLHVKRGPGGGYYFPSPIHQISVLQLVQAIDGKDTFKKCALGRPQCSGRNACAIHPIWEKTREKLIAELGSTTVNQLIDKKREKK
jgi:Rrf2 family protein